nr:hypothetical protein [Tanacetum cinerariifolium]
NRLDVPTRQILDSKGAIPTKTNADAKVAIPEMVEYSQKWHNETSSKNKSTKTSNGLAAIQDQLNSLGREIKKVNEKYRVAGPGFYQRKSKNSSYPDRRQTIEESLTKFMAKSAKRHEENSNIIKEIRASTDATIKNQGALIKTLEIQIGQMSKVLQERGFRSLPNSTETILRDQVKSFSTIKADSTGIRRIGSGQHETPCLRKKRTQEALLYPILFIMIGKIVFSIDFIILDILEDDNVPLISDDHSCLSPMPR